MLGTKPCPWSWLVLQSPKMFRDAIRLPESECGSEIQQLPDDGSIVCFKDH